LNPNCKITGGRGAGPPKETSLGTIAPRPRRSDDLHRLKKILLARFCQSEWRSVYKDAAVYAAL